MDLNSQIKSYLNLLREGLGLKVKLIILLYILFAPLRFIHKIFKCKFSRHYFGNVVIKNIDGMFDCGKSYISSRIVTTDSEKELRKFFNIDGGVFIDVGAHIGKYTVTVARKIRDSGKVIAIEPEPFNFSLLSQNVVLNHLNNVILQNVACSVRDSKAVLYVHEDCPTLHSFYINQGLKKIEVNTVTLDTLIKNLKIDRVDFIKIDVEAAETDVFRGAVSVLQSYHPQIIFEAYDEIALNQINKIISNFNYKIKKIDGKNYYAY